MSRPGPQRRGPLPVEIELELPDGQRVRARLHERKEVAGPHRWRYRVAVPSWVERPDGVAAADYVVWVTHKQLIPLKGIDLSGVPTRRLPGPPPPLAPGRVVRPDPEHRSRTVIHEASCRRAAGGGRELATVEALDALMRIGARACTDCDASAVLVPALALGEGYG